MMVQYFYDILYLKEYLFFYLYFTNDFILRFYSWKPILYCGKNCLRKKERKKERKKVGKG